MPCPLEERGYALRARGRACGGGSAGRAGGVGGGCGRVRAAGAGAWRGRLRRGTRVGVCGGGRTARARSVGGQHGCGRATRTGRASPAARALQNRLIIGPWPHIILGVVGRGRHVRALPWCPPRARGGDPGGSWMGVLHQSKCLRRTRSDLALFLGMRIPVPGPHCLWLCVVMLTSCVRVCRS